VGAFFSGGCYRDCSYCGEFNGRRLEARLDGGRVNLTTLGELPVLKIQNLSVAYHGIDGWVEAVRDFSLEILPGQTYGLVGESGSGKTTIAMSIMRYLGSGGRITQGSIVFEGKNLLDLSEKQMGEIWGEKITLVPQNPLSSLNPSLRIGEQITEVLRYRRGLNRTEARSRAEQMLRMMRMKEPQSMMDSYPHQISGGMQQRILIAMALITAPKLLILDEPTTSLDVTTQASILDLIQDLVGSIQTAVLYVTHNLGVIARICDRVAVLYAGELVEDAPLADLFDKPLHPYTQGLLDSIPNLGDTKYKGGLRSIEGQIPPLGNRPTGCVFAARCPVAIEICQQSPLFYPMNLSHRSRCHRWEEIAQGLVSARQPKLELRSKAHEGVSSISSTDQAAEVLSLKNLSVDFTLGRTFTARLKAQPKRRVRAVRKVNLELRKGKTIGLVGESGSGKTTLARAVVGLVEPSAGEVALWGLPLPAKLSQRNFDTLRRLQMVFQNPDEALNPYMTVGASLKRSLLIFGNKTGREADEEVVRLLEAVRLPPEIAARKPSKLSGGEKQRVAIARAFSSNPDLLLADEPVSLLDVSVQASILNLLTELQLQRENASLFISHDLAVVGYLSDEIAVIYQGELMQLCPAVGLFQPPHHPYAEALLSAIPSPTLMQQQNRIRLEDAGREDGGQGCPFYKRCPRSLGEKCAKIPPPWQQGEHGLQILCHIPLEELLAIQSSSMNEESQTREKGKSTP
jgi:peptide/nickel transport system ATP-binding protein